MMNCKKILMHCMKSNRDKFVLCFLAGTVLAVLPPFLSLLLSDIAKRMEMVYDRKLPAVVLLFLFLKLLHTVGEALSAYFQKEVQISCVADSRITVYDFLTKLELRGVLEQTTGKWMNYMKLIDAYCNEALLLGYQVITKCISFVLASLFLVHQNATIFLYTMLSILLWLGMSMAVNKFVERNTLKKTNAESSLYENITYLFDHLETVVSSGKEDFAVRRYESAFQKKRNAELALQKLLAFKEELLDKAFVEIFRIVLILLAVFGSNSSFLAVALLYFYLAENVFSSVIGLRGTWKKVIAWKAKEQQLVAFFTLPQKEEKMGHFDVEADPVIRMEHVSLSFDTQQVLKDISLEIPKGKITVIIGKSGEGKSSLLRLMQGVYKPDEGHSL